MTQAYNAWAYSQETLYPSTETSANSRSGMLSHNRQNMETAYIYIYPATDNFETFFKIMQPDSGGERL